MQINCDVMSFDEPRSPISTHEFSQWQHLQCFGWMLIEQTEVKATLNYV